MIENPVDGWVFFCFSWNGAAEGIPPIDNVITHFDEDRVRFLRSHAIDSRAIERPNGFFPYKWEVLLSPAHYVEYQLKFG